MGRRGPPKGEGGALRKEINLVPPVIDSGVRL